MRTIVRLGSIVLAALACVGAIAAGGAVGHELGTRDAQVQVADGPALLPVSRRAEPSLDRYIRTAREKTRASDLTVAQRWMAARAHPIVAYDSAPEVSMYLLGWEGGPPVTAYVNATGVNLSNVAGLRDARAWLLRAAGQQVRVDGWAALDIRQDAARRWWLYGSDDQASCHPDRDRRGALDLVACGYDGLWVDNVLTVPSQWLTPDPRINAREWGEALVRLLQELRAALPEGKTVAINAHWTDLDFPYAAEPSIDTNSPLVRAAQQADQLVLEGGAADPGLVYGAPASTAWSFRRLLKYATAMHQVGVRLEWEKTSSSDLLGKDRRGLKRIPSCSDRDYRRAQPAWKRGSTAWKAHVRTAAFNAASAYLTFVPGDRLGDMCEYPGRGWRGYGVSLGWPLGPLADDGQIISRTFTEGAVVVNPGRTPAKVQLPPGRAGVNLASTDPEPSSTPRTRFTVPGRAALVVRYAETATSAED